MRNMYDPKNLSQYRSCKHEDLEVSEAHAGAWRVDCPGCGLEFTGLDTELPAPRFRVSLEEWQTLLEIELGNKHVNYLKDQLKSVYQERNRLVSFLSRTYPSHLCLHDREDQSWEREWLNIVCIHSPQGQLTWHVHDDEKGLFSHLPVKKNHWDGHTSQEKYTRLLSIKPIQI